MNFDELTQAELGAFEAFREKYMVQNPPPVIRAAKGLGWQFWFAMLWAVSAVIMVALRTASEFHKAEVLSGMEGWMANFSSANVLLAIEGGIVIAAAIKAAHERSFSSQRLGWGIGLALFISMSAGLNSTIGVIPNASETLINTIRYVLLGAIGIGGSLLAWVSGEILGEQLAWVLADRDNAKVELHKAEGEYNESLLSAWSRSAEYQIVRKGVKVEAAEAAHEVRSVKAVRSLPNDRTNSERTNHLKNAGSNEQRMRIAEYIASIVSAEGRVPGPTEISRSLDVAKSYAHQVRQEWIEENSGQL